MREYGLLAAAVPTEHGGEGASVAELSVIATELGRACAATGMVFAMHQGQVMALWRHGGDGAGVLETIEAVRGGALVASSTTESGVGGDARRSTCSIEPTDDGRIRLRKDAPVISYATEADAVLVTARRDPDAPASDQRLLDLPDRRRWSCRRPRRGTPWGSAARAATAGSSTPRPRPTACSATTTRRSPPRPCCRSRTCSGPRSGSASPRRPPSVPAARSASRPAPASGRPRPGPLRLAELLVDLQALADAVRHAAERFDAVADDPDVLGSSAYALAANALKIGASERVTDIVTKALRIVGIAGLRRLRADEHRPTPPRRPRCRRHGEQRPSPPERRRTWPS